MILRYTCTNHWTYTCVPMPCIIHIHPYMPYIRPSSAIPYPYKSCLLLSSTTATYRLIRASYSVLVSNPKSLIRTTEPSALLYSPRSFIRYAFLSNTPLSICIPLDCIKSNVSTFLKLYHHYPSPWLFLGQMLGEIYKLWMKNIWDINCGT